MPYDYADLFAAAKEVATFCLMFFPPVVLATYVVTKLGIDR